MRKAMVQVWGKVPEEAVAKRLFEIVRPVKNPCLEVQRWTLNQSFSELQAGTSHERPLHE